MAAPPPPPVAPPVQGGAGRLPMSGLPPELQTIAFNAEEESMEAKYKQYWDAIRNWEQREADYRQYVMAAHRHVGESAQIAVNNYMNNEATAAAYNTYWNGYWDSYQHWWDSNNTYWVNYQNWWKNAYMMKPPGDYR